jgi:hypothetical protein
MYLALGLPLRDPRHAVKVWSLRLNPSRIHALVDEQPEVEHGLHSLPDVRKRLIRCDPAERNAKRLGESLFAGRFTKPLPQERGSDVHDEELVGAPVEEKQFILERCSLNLGISSKCHGLIGQR